MPVELLAKHKLTNGKGKLLELKCLMQNTWMTHKQMLSQMLVHKNNFG